MAPAVRVDMDACLSPKLNPAAWAAIQLDS
jgi:hypothetical protein